MRIVASTILAIGTILATAPAQAQTYDPSYPVCMKVYTGSEGGGGEWNDCTYMSQAQCAATASGRPASCRINPYYALADTRRPRHVQRKVHRVY
jgi:Protein of unknown function (DUF3551)